MYRLLYDDAIIFDPYGESNEVVTDAKMSIEINAPAYLDFVMGPEHPLYNTIQERDGIVTLYSDNDILFEGVVDSISDDFHQYKSISCVSALDYINDVVTRPYSTSGGTGLLTAPDTIDKYFEWLINMNNEYTMSPTKQFEVGVNQGSNLSATNRIFTESSGGTTIGSEITSKILDTFGGYLSLRYEDGRKILDLYSDVHEMNAQVIDFGVNLLDFARSRDTADQYTALRPTGGTPEGRDQKPITLSSIDDGPTSFNVDVAKQGDVIYSISGVQRYGYKEGTWSTDDTTDPLELLEMAIPQLVKQSSPIISIDVKAVDLALYMEGYEHLKIGQAVRIRSKPHNIDEYLMVSSISLDLQDPGQSEYMLGASYDTLTGQQSTYLRALNSGINSSLDKVEALDRVDKEQAIAIGNAQQAADDAQQSADNAQNTANNAQNTANNAQNTANSNKEEIDVLKEIQADHEKQFEQIQAGIDQAEQEIDGINDRLDQMDTEAGEVQASIDAVRQEAKTNFETAKAAADAAQAKADAVGADLESFRTETGESIQNVKDSVSSMRSDVDAVEQKAADLASELDGTKATVEQVTTDLGEVKTTVSNAATKADQALQVSTSASQTATEAQTTATSAYQDAQSALTQSSVASQTANAVKTELETKYSTTDEIAEQYATKSLVEQTSQSITSTVEATYATKATVEALENIANNAVQTWMGSGVPTLSNEPASDWTTAELKSQHSGDIYYDSDTGYSYRFGSSNGNNYSWSLIKDTDISKAVADAAKAQQTAEGVSDEVTQLKTDIPATYATKTEVKQTTDSIKSTVSEVAATANSALSKATTVEQTANGLQTTVTEQASKIDQNTTTISQVSQRVDSVSSTITQVQGDVDSLNSSIRLINPSFETGDTTGWKFFGYQTAPYVNDSSPRSGTYKLVFPSMDAPGDISIENDAKFPVKAGEVYRISLSVRPDKIASASVGLKFSDDSTANYNQQFDIGWHEYSGTVTIPSGQTEAHFRLGMNVDAGCHVRVDSVTIENISDAKTATDTANSALSQSSRVEQSLDSFKTSVSRDYQTKTDALSQKSELEQNINSFKTTVSETYTTKDEFNALEIGGTNLILDSKPVSNTGFFNSNLWTIVPGEYASARWRGDETATKNSYYSISFPLSAYTIYDESDPEWVKKGDKFVWSFDIKIDDYDGGEIYLLESYIGLRYNGDATNPENLRFGSVILGNNRQIINEIFNTRIGEWVHVTSSAIADADYSPDGKYQNALNFGFRNKQPGFTVYLRNVKLERGTKATAWSPAPEDFDDKYTSKTEFKQTTDKISATATAASQNASSALSKVSSLEVSVDGINTKVEEVASDADEAVKTASQVSQRVDSLSSTITQVSKLVDGSLAQQYLTNPDFETGDDTGWTFTNFSNHVVNTASPYTGKYKVYVQPPTNGNVQRMINSKVFTVTPGQRFRLSAAINADNPTTKAATLGLLNSEDTSKFITGVINVDSSSYKTYSATVTIPTGWSKAQFRFGTVDTGYGTMRLDSFMVLDVSAGLDAQETANSAMSQASRVEQSLDSFKTSVQQTYETKNDALNKQSSLQQSVNNLRTEVSETYTTKTEFDNLEIGGTNLVKDSKPYGKSGFFEHFDSVTGNEYGEITLESTTTSQSYPSVTLDYSNTFTFDKTDIVKGDKYVISYDVMMLERTYTASSTFTESWIGIRHNGGNWAGLIKYDGIKEDFLSAPLNEWAHFEHPITANAWDGTTSIGARIQLGTKSVGKFHFRMRNVKLEKGSKATAWSPAPEDLLTDAEAAQTYSTKSYVDQTARTVSLGVVEEYKDGQHGSALATQSDITAAKDSITSTVSQTYAKKNDVGVGNLIKNGDFSDGSSNWTTNGGTSKIVDGTYGKQFVFTQTGTNVNGSNRIYNDTYSHIKGQAYEVSFYAKADKSSKWHFGPNNPSEAASVTLDTTLKQYTMQYQASSTLILSIWTDNPTATIYLERVKLSVASGYYATKTEFDNLQVGGTNLFVIGTSKDGFRVSADGGEFSDPGYTISDYISVQPNEKYILTAYVDGSGNDSDDYVSIARYRSDKSWIDRPIMDTNSFKYGDSWAITATSETAYVRLSFPTSGKGKFKFERGTKSTDWSPAPEDIDESFADLADIVNANNANTASLIQSSIEQTKDSIISQVEASYYTKTEAEELMTQMSTQFQQTENSFEMQFNALRMIVDQVNESADTNYSNIQKYIRFVDGHIVIGVEGNPFSLDIGNDRISFMQNNSEIAYISNHEFYITSGIITQNLRIGNFEFRPRSNGNLSLSLAGI